MSPHISDNLFPSAATTQPPYCNSIAINCTNLHQNTNVDTERRHSAALERAYQFTQQSLSENSRRAYASDLARFLDWGGSVPASDVTLAAYLAGHAESHSTATLARWIASIAKAHRAAGRRDPSKSELVKMTLRGIRRQHGSAQKQAKPLMREDLFLALDAMGDSPKDVRDRALLLIGFAGGFRRSELVSLDYSDIQHVRQGIVIRLRRSKTDQVGAGRKIGIPHGRTRHCPVAALSAWTEKCEDKIGAVFRRVNRHGQTIGVRLAGEALSIILKARVAAVGIDPTGFSGHSIRAGFVTSAVMQGASTWKIRAQTGHASDTMLARYIRDANLFDFNSAGVVL